MRKIVVGDAGATVADRHPAVVQRHLDHAIGAELGGVVDQVDDGPVDRRRAARHLRVVTRHGDLTTGPAPHPRRSLFAQRLQIAVLLWLVVAPIGCQFDQFVDQRGQLLGLTVEIVDELLTGLGRQVVHPAQHGNIGAQARQWRAQLMTGVLHQLLLLLAAARQGAEHPVHRLAQAARFVGPADRHFDVEATGLGDIVGGLGEADEAAGDLPADQPAEKCRADDDERHRQQRAFADDVERTLGLTSRAGDLHRATTVDRDRQHAEGLALDGDIAWLADAGGCAAGHGPIGVVDGQFAGLR